MRVYSPCKGKVQDIQYVDDKIFSQYMMGVGFFVVTDDNDIYSPVEGKVEFVADTKHAIVIKTDECSVMVHVGLDTCHLKGKPFNILVNEGDEVSLNQKIMEVDHNLIRENNFNDDVIVIVIENKDETLLQGMPVEVLTGDVVINH